VAKLRYEHEIAIIRMMKSVYGEGLVASVCDRRKAYKVPVVKPE
jgi:hypothetical protein